MEKPIREVTADELLVDIETIEQTPRSFILQLAVSAGEPGYRRGESIYASVIFRCDQYGEWRQIRSLAESIEWARQQWAQDRDQGRFDFVDRDEVPVIEEDDYSELDAVP